MYIYFFQVKPIGPTTTEDIADIDSNRVSLDLPGQLVGSSVTLITKISEIIGELILVSESYTEQPPNHSVNFSRDICVMITNAVRPDVQLTRSNSSII